MSKTVELNAKIREKDSNLFDLRKEGFVPGIVYGSGSKNINLSIPSIELEKAYASAGESSLIDLKIDDKETFKVLVKDTQIDGRTDKFLHVDLYKVDMAKKIVTNIPFNFIGESKAVKEMGAILMKNVDSVEVECLPGDLIDSIDVDLSAIVTIQDSIRVEDLKVPDTVRITNNPRASVASVIDKSVANAQEDAKDKAAEDSAATAPAAEAEAEAEGEDGGEEKKEDASSDATEEKKE